METPLGASLKQIQSVLADLKNEAGKYGPQFLSKKAKLLGSVVKRRGADA